VVGNGMVFFAPPFWCFSTGSAELPLLIYLAKVLIRFGLSLGLTGKVLILLGLFSKSLK
jgi:hypothetical protein